MKVLVLNCGSSSLKYQLMDMRDESVLAKGLVERIAISGSRIKHSKAGIEPVVKETDIPNHTVAIKLVLDALLDPGHGVIKNLNELAAAGHRVVHGGEKFASSAVVTPEVITSIENVIPLAPLHNPANLMGIRAMQDALPSLPNVAVFDTAFHQTMPPHAYVYGIPYEFYERDGIRCYGFHGTSHYYVAMRTAEILGKPVESLKIITCHLGNGSSITAVRGGKSVDVSLGMGTTHGILMGTRAGILDASVVLRLVDDFGGDTQKVSDLIHKKSGLEGVSGISSDMRDIEDAAGKGNTRAQLALDMLCYGIRKHIGAYAGAMDGVDAIAFTAGIGENSTTVRELVCKHLGYLGAKFDPAKNKVRGVEAEISAPDSKVKLLVVPTNEELVIARDTQRLVGEAKK